MLSTIISILLMLPDIILTILKIIELKNKKNLHTINNQAVSQNNTQLLNSNDNQIIVGDNNIQKNNCNNVSISINNNKHYYFGDQNSVNSTNNTVADAIALFILLIAFYLYKENKVIIFIIAFISSLLYFVGAKDYWEKYKVKSNSIIVMISFYLTFILSAILCIIASSKDIKSSLSNVVGYLYSFVGIVIICTFVAIFTWNNLKSVLNYTINKLALNIKYRFAIYEDTQKLMVLSIMLLVAQLVLFFCYIKYSY